MRPTRVGNAWLTSFCCPAEKGASRPDSDRAPPATESYYLMDQIALCSLMQASDSCEVGTREHKAHYLGVSIMQTF